MRLLLYIKFCLLLMVTTAVAQVPASEENEGLKEIYLQALQDVSHNAPIKFQSFHLPLIDSVISSIVRDGLENDPGIREVLRRIEDKHPISSTRVQAKHALSETPRSILYIIGGNGLNQSRKYCLAQSVNAKPLSALPSDIEEKLKPVRQDTILLSETGEVVEPLNKVEGINISARNVSGGWLTGYGPKSGTGFLTITHVGLGLHYVPDDTALPTEFLLPGTVHAIIPKSGDTDAYFVIATRPHFAFGEPARRHGPLVIYLVKETNPTKFEINEYRKLPAGLRKVAKMENGDLFLSFGGPGPTSYWRGTETKAFNDNPPIGFTPNGKIYAVCEEDAVQF